MDRVRAIEYQKAERRLIVHLEAGEPLRYHNVGPPAHDAFLASENRDHYHQKYIHAVYIQEHAK